MNEKMRLIMKKGRSMKSPVSRKFVFVWVMMIAILLPLAGCAQVQTLLQAQPTPTVLPTVAPKGGISAEGRVAPRDFTSLAFAANGKVAELLVKEGDTVKKGDVLARLGDREQIDAALSAADLAVLDAQQTLDRLNRKADLAGRDAEKTLHEAERAVIEAQKVWDTFDTNDYDKKLDDAQKTVNDDKDKLKDFQDAFDKLKDLSQDNADRKKAEDDLKDAQKKYDGAVRELDLLKNAKVLAQTNIAAASAHLADAQREADARSKGPDAEDLALAQARLASAKAQQAAAQAAQRNLDLTAPYDGTIIELSIASGERAVAGQSVLLLADLSKWYVETTDLSEINVVRLSLGQKTSVTPDALPELTLKGTVESISDLYKEKSGDINYTVRILLKDVDPLLRWGMTVQVTFE